MFKMNLYMKQKKLIDPENGLVEGVQGEGWIENLGLAEANYYI